ncbi:hypothetical protein [Halopseudomonas sp.]|uniref:hypothetical protein n=1 Tax=Halopseudomonas sp. TaxID=2901191 RepID=UPI003569642E
MINRTPKTSMLALGLSLLVLSGCDAASESAQKLFDDTVEKTTEAARQVVNDTVGDVMDEVNKQVDVVQKGINETLGKPVEEAEADQGTTEQAADESANLEENRG